MNRAAILAPIAFLLAFAGPASLFPSCPSQDSASPAPSQKPADPESPAAPPSPAPPKKAKKVWTNENLGEAAAGAVSQPGEQKDNSPLKNTPAKPASAQEVAEFRKQLTTLQTQLAAVEKQLAQLNSFRKGETPGAVGLQLHKGYSTEPIDDQIRKLEQKRDLLAVRVDAVFDAARKRGVEPGQLR